MQSTDVLRIIRDEHEQSVTSIIERGFNEFERERGLRRYVFEAFDRESMWYALLCSISELLKRGGKILDVGCGRGVFLKELNMLDREGGLRLVGVDLSPLSGEGDITWIGGNILSRETFRRLIQLGPFDLVVSVFTFMYLPNPFIGLKRVYRLLEVDGEAFIEGIPVGILLQDDDEQLKKLQQVLEQQGVSINTRFVPCVFLTDRIGTVVWDLYWKKTTNNLHLPVVPLSQTYRTSINGYPISYQLHKLADQNQ